jgi:hypothetical protein
MYPARPLQGPIDEDSDGPAVTQRQRVPSAFADAAFCGRNRRRRWQLSRQIGEFAIARGPQRLAASNDGEIMYEQMAGVSQRVKTLTSGSMMAQIMCNRRVRNR